MGEYVNGDVVEQIAEEMDDVPIQVELYSNT